MNSILFEKISQLLIPSLALLIGIVIIFRYRKNTFTLLVTLILTISAVINLKYYIFNTPNLVESQNYFSKFQNLNSNSIDSIIINTKTINFKQYKEQITITDKKIIEKTLSIFDYNEFSIFYTRKSTIKDSYFLKFITSSDKIYEFEIFKLEDETGYLYLILNDEDKSFRIGKYVNSFLKNLNLIENTIQ